MRKLIVSEFVSMDGVIQAPGGSSQLVHALLANELVDEVHLVVYPLTLGSGKRLWAEGVHATFQLRSARPYPTGVVALDYVRAR